MRLICFSQEHFLRQKLCYIRSTAYTYPYDISGRLTDTRLAIKERRLDGLIHYTQTFCHRQIYDMIFREELDIPILTLEGDRPGRLDTRTSLRIETFVEMLKGTGG